MSIESDLGDGDSLETEIDDLAADLGQAIADLPVYEEFRETKEALEADDEAQEKIEEFEKARNEFLVARQTGEATQADLEELQAKQEELNSLPVMETHNEAKEALQERLLEINETISESLAVDFADSSSACCHDE